MRKGRGGCNSKRKDTDCSSRILRYIDFAGKLRGKKAIGLCRQAVGKILFKLYQLLQKRDAAADDGIIFGRKAVGIQVLRSKEDVLPLHFGKSLRLH